MMKRYLIISLLAIAGCSKVNDAENANLPPSITLKISDKTPAVGAVVQFVAEVSDPNPGDSVTVTWTVSDGELSASTGLTVDWTAPDDTTTVLVEALASDGNGGNTRAEIYLPVGNSPPEITQFIASSSHVITGNSIILRCSGSDAEGSELTYQFTDLSGEGLFEHGSALLDSAKWTSPIISSAAEKYLLEVTVADELNFVSKDTLEILVYTNYGSVWVVDGGHRSLTKYTSNGLQVLTANYAFVNPVSVVSNINEPYGCFVADQGANQVVQISADGEPVATFPELSFVSDLAIHYASRKVWAVSYGSSSVTVIDVIIGAVEKTVSGFVNPTAIEINQRTGDVWILEEGNNRAIQLNVNSGITGLPDSISTENANIFRTGFNAPHRLCFHNIKSDNLLSYVYIADLYDDQIERIKFEDNVFEQLGPVDLLSPNPVLLDVISLNLKDYVLVVNSYGRLELFEEASPQQKHTLNGNYEFIKPVAMHLDARTNECWIGDTGTNQLVKIKINNDYSFSVIRKISGFLAIKGIAVNM